MHGHQALVGENGGALTVDKNGRVSPLKRKKTKVKVAGEMKQAQSVKEPKRVAKGTLGRGESHLDRYGGQGRCWSLWRFICCKGIESHKSKNRTIFMKEIKQAQRLKRRCCCG